MSAAPNSSSSSPSTRSDAIASATASRGLVGLPQDLVRDCDTVMTVTSFRDVHGMVDGLPGS